MSSTTPLIFWYHFIYPAHRKSHLLAKKKNVFAKKSAEGSKFAYQVKISACNNSRLYIILYVNCDSSPSIVECNCNLHLRSSLTITQYIWCLKYRIHELAKIDSNHAILRLTALQHYNYSRFTHSRFKWVQYIFKNHTFL